MSWENKGSFPVTVVVAASNSLNPKQANYICDGVNDEVEIQLAEVAAAGGDVILLDGDFNCSSLLISNSTVRGQGARGTIISISTGITIRGDGNLQSCLVDAGAGFAGIAVLVDAVSEAVPSFSGRLNLLQGVEIKADYGHHTGTGLRLLATQTGGTYNACIETSHFGAIKIRNFQYGLVLYADEQGTQDAWVNGNTFEHLEIDNCVYPIHISRTFNGECSGNKFVSGGIQPDASTLDGIMVGAGCDHNDFGIFLWDWDPTAGQAWISSSLVHFTGTGYRYVLEGYAPEIQDLKAVDDFITGSPTSGQIGALGWITGAGGVDYGTSSDDHPGNLEVYTTGVLNNINYLCHAGANYNLLVEAHRFDMVFIVYPNVRTDIALFFGAMDDFNAAIGNQARAGFEFDTGQGDTNWMLCTGTGAASTRTDSGVAVTGDWFKLCIRRIGSAAFDYYINGVYIGRVTTNSPGATTLNYGCHIQTLAATGKMFIIDYFHLLIRNLLR